MRRGKRQKNQSMRDDVADNIVDFQQLPFCQPRLNIEPVKYISDDEVHSIHQASIKILKDIGIEFNNDEALDILHKAGVDVDFSTKMVRIDESFVHEAVKSAPSSFTVHARNPERNIKVGDGYIGVSPVSSAPNCADLDEGRRPGNKHDFQKFVRLTHMLNSMHFFGGYPVEPIDIHTSVRHLDCTYDFITLSDKSYHAYSLGTDRVLDVLEMTRIARNVSEQQLEQEPSLMTVINSNSPLKLDTPMLQGIIEMSRRGQIVILTPFTLAGAMAPVTLAGALAQQNAEALAGLTISQLVKKGAPFVYGGFTSNVDMKSGAPAFGTPEYMKAAIISGQLARYYNLPFRSSNTCAANYPDAQAAYESVFSLWGAIMGGVNIIKHGAGWMEGGLQASFEKMIIDADLLQMIYEFLKPISFNESDFALDAIKEVGPGGHFFGCEHTQARYRNAFYSPILSDWRNYETWQQAGSPKTHEKANKVYKSLLENYTPPPLDAGIHDELKEFIAKRKGDGGAVCDF